MNRRLQPLRGASLIEVVLAVVVMGIAFPALANLFGGLTVLANRPSRITLATQLAANEAEILVADHRSRDTVNYGYRNLTAARYPDQAISGFTGYMRTIRFTTDATNRFKDAVVTVTGPFNVRARLNLRLWRYTQP